MQFIWQLFDNLGVDNMRIFGLSGQKGLYKKQKLFTWSPLPYFVRIIKVQGHQNLLSSLHNPLEASQNLCLAFCFAILPASLQACKPASLQACSDRSLSLSLCLGRRLLQNPPQNQGNCNEITDSSSFSGGGGCGRFCERSHQLQSGSWWVQCMSWEVFV